MTFVLSRWFRQTDCFLPWLGKERVDWAGPLSFVHLSCVELAMNKFKRHWRNETSWSQSIDRDAGMNWMECEGGVERSGVWSFSWDPNKDKRLRYATICEVRLGGETGEGTGNCWTLNKGCSNAIRAHKWINWWTNDWWDCYLAI